MSRRKETADFFARRSGMFAFEVSIAVDHFADLVGRGR